MSAPSVVDRDPVAIIEAAPAEEGRVSDVALRVELDDKDVGEPAAA